MKPTTTSDSAKGKKKIDFMARDRNLTLLNPSARLKPKTKAAITPTRVQIAVFRKASQKSLSLESLVKFSNPMKL